MKAIKEIYKVDGMSCTACAASVNSMLSAVDGVISANVNFANQTVLVEFDPEKAPLKKLEEAVSKIGYNLITDKNLMADEDAREVRRFVEQQAILEAQAFAPQHLVRQGEQARIANPRLQ